MKRIAGIILAILIGVPAVVIAVQMLHDPGSDIKSQATAPVDSAQQLARGAYLVKAGNCMTCHTARGRAVNAGGRALPSEFGVFYSSNITPDVATGIGDWNADDFWRALHNGKSKDGSFLYPAFPYTNYTKVTRADSDAMYAYLRTIAPVRQVNREHDLRFPFDQRLLLAGWRALYFRPGVFESTPGQTAQWNRGAYLVEGLGHCSACHTARNALGAVDEKASLAGAMMPVLNWYAPPLASPTHSSLADWESRHLQDLLKTGVSARGAVFGPMAEVVQGSLQHLSDADIGAMAVYLKSLSPQGREKPIPDSASAPVSPPENSALNSALFTTGAALYEKNCAACHGADGKGSPPAYPPLAVDGGQSLSPPVNAIRMVLNGGFPPSTAGNPRPYGMPPFGNALNDAQIAAVVYYIRNAWGTSSEPITAADVGGYRGVPVE